MKLIGCYCDREFAARIDAARGALSRSQFARDSLAEKCGRMGFPVPVNMVNAPDRAGKGGPKSSSSSRAWKVTVDEAARLNDQKADPRDPAKSQPAPARPLKSYRKSDAARRRSNDTDGSDHK